MKNNLLRTPKASYFLLGSLISLSFLILASCSSPEKMTLSSISGFGGTGYKPSGFGGTGIVGTITEFGSIWVNGVEIHYDDNSQINSNLSTKDTLKLGGQVVLETLQGNDKTETKKISIYYPIAGRITRVEKNQIILNNQFVIKTSRAKMDKGIQLKAGEYIAINGFEVSANQWVATRINHNPQHKVFYQEIPELNFSKSVKQILIESSAIQLQKWKGEIKGEIDQASKNLERVIVIGRVDDSGHINIDAIESYASLPKSMNKKSMLARYHSLMFNKKKSTRKGAKKGKSNQNKGENDHSKQGYGFGNGGDYGHGRGSGSGGRHH